MRLELISEQELHFFYGKGVGGSARVLFTFMYVYSKATV